VCATERAVENGRAGGASWLIHRSVVNVCTVPSHFPLMQNR
jgi:hypothetical protein